MIRSSEIRSSDPLSRKMFGLVSYFHFEIFNQSICYKDSFYYFQKITFQKTITHATCFILRRKASFLSFIFILLYLWEFLAFFSAKYVVSTVNLRWAGN